MDFKPWAYADSFQNFILKPNFSSSSVRLKFLLWSSELCNQTSENSEAQLSCSLVLISTQQLFPHVSAQCFIALLIFDIGTSVE